MDQNNTPFPDGGGFSSITSFLVYLSDADAAGYILPAQPHIQRPAGCSFILRGLHRGPERRLTAGWGTVPFTGTIAGDYDLTKPNEAYLCTAIRSRNTAATNGRDAWTLSTAAEALRGDRQRGERLSVLRPIPGKPTRTIRTSFGAGTITTSACGRMVHGPATTTSRGIATTTGITFRR